jgi:hypothetical protein
VAGTVLSTDLVAGPVVTVNGASVTVSLTGGVKVNDANVTTADVTADNGVVHVIDKVLLPSASSILDNEQINVEVYPNPTVDFINLKTDEAVSYDLIDLSGKVLLSGNVSNSASINISNLNAGSYILSVVANNKALNYSITKN